MKKKTKINQSDVCSKKNLQRHTKDNGSSLVRPRGYRYGSLFLIIRAETEITSPDVISTQESTNDDRIDNEPERYDATA